MSDLSPTLYTLHPDGSHSEATEREVRMALAAFDSVKAQEVPDDWEIRPIQPVHSVSVNHRGHWVGDELRCWDCPAVWKKP